MSEVNVNTVGDGTFDDMIADASPTIQELASATRRLIADVMPGITEVPWLNQRIAGYGVGPKKMSEHFCYIAPLKNRVNLGFMYGADLTDPQGLLEGEGKLLRHVKVNTLQDLENPALRDLVTQASTHLPKLKS